MSTLEELAATFPGELGVWAIDLNGGAIAEFNGNTPFYLASVAKVAILVAAVEALDSTPSLTLASTHEIELFDYRDEVHWALFHHIGTKPTLEELLQAMIRDSDATATDMVVRLVGVSRINETLSRLGIDGLGRITSLGALDRMVAAARGSGWEQIPPHAQRPFRVDANDELMIPAYRESAPALGESAPSAYLEYYKTGLNTATPRAIGRLLRMIATNAIFGPANPLGGPFNKNSILRDLFGAADEGRLGIGLPAILDVDTKGGGKHRVRCQVGIVDNAGNPAVLAVFTQGHDAGGWETALDTIEAAAAEAWRRLFPPSDMPTINITSAANLYHFGAMPPVLPPLTWTTNGLGGLALRLDVVEENRDRSVRTLDSNLRDDGQWADWDDLRELAEGRYRFRISARDEPDLVSDFSVPFELRGTAPVPRLRLQQPVAGALFRRGEHPTIRWESHGLTGRLTLTLWRQGDEGEALVETVADRIPNAGSFASWEVPDDIAPGGGYRFKLTSNDDPEMTATSPYFALGGGLRILSPARTTRYLPGETPTLRWSSVGLEGNLRLTLVRPGGQSSLLSSNVANGGEWRSWTVPDDAEQSDGYQLRLRTQGSPRAEDRSEPFTIGGRIEVLHPDENEILEPGANAAVAWQSEDIEGPVRIELRRGEDHVQQVIAEEAPNTGSFSPWRVSDDIGLEGEGFRIVITSVRHPGIFGSSPYFQVGTRYEWLSPAIEQRAFDGARNVRPSFLAHSSTPTLRWRRIGAARGDLDILLVRGSLRRPVATGVDDVGECRTWTVQEKLPPASDYQLELRPRSHPELARRSQPFDLGARIDVALPFVGDDAVTDLRGGDVVGIRWRSRGLPSDDRVRIELLDGPIVAKVLRASVGRDNRFSMRVPDDLDTAGRYRIRVRSHELPAVVGTSPWFGFEG